MDKSESDALRIGQNDIKFLCEQDGPVEQRLKDALRDIFFSDRTVRRAYLIRIVDKRIGQEGAALCLSIKGKPSQALLQKVFDSFGRLFSIDAFLDIIELNGQVEKLVTSVARPFYRRKGRIARMFNAPCWYLVFNEGLYFDHPFLCTPLQRTTFGSRDDCLLVRLSPSVRYTDSDECECCTEHVVLNARFEGKSVVRNCEWPLIVKAMLLQQFSDPGTGRLEYNEVGVGSFGFLYKSRRAAEKEARHTWNMYTKPFWIKQDD